MVTLNPDALRASAQRIGDLKVYAMMPSHVETLLVRSAMITD
jgi:hypothetical protein